MDRKTTAAIVLGALLGLVPLVPPASAQAAATPPSPELRVTIFATSVGGQFRFVPAEILVGSTPTNITVTVRNTDPTNVLHTFTIDNQGRTGQLVNLQLPGLNAEGNATFELNSTTKIRVGANASTNAETFSDAKGQAIRFYCIPHRGVGMVGAIRVAAAAVAGPQPYQGFQLWAFWIGSIAMVAMLGFIGVTYFVIKGSSRHNVDEREHIRRGLP